MKRHFDYFTNFVLLGSLIIIIEVITLIMLVL